MCGHIQGSGRSAATSVTNGSRSEARSSHTSKLYIHKEEPLRKLRTVDDQLLHRRKRGKHCNLNLKSMTKSLKAALYMPVTGIKGASSSRTLIRCSDWLMSQQHVSYSRTFVQVTCTCITCLMMLDLVPIFGSSKFLAELQTNDEDLNQPGLPEILELLQYNSIIFNLWLLNILIIRLLSLCCYEC